MSGAVNAAYSLVKRRGLPLACALLALPVSAATYTAPSGYLQIVGYKLQRAEHDGRPELAVTGWVEALADCRGATLLFDVLDRDGGRVGTIAIAHGAFFRHDRWALDQGVFTPEGRDAAQAMAAADHVLVRQADCS
jgi:hypothetical protein